MDAWLLVGLLQPIFVGFIFAQRGRRKAQSLWLFAWLGVAFIHQFAIYMGYAHPNVISPWLSIGLGLLPFLHGPMAFGYVATLLPRMNATRYLWVHILPFIGFWAAYVFINATGASGLIVDTSYGVSLLYNKETGAPFDLPPWLMAVSGGAYPLFALYLLRKQRSALRQMRSSVDAVKFRWLEFWIFGHFTAFAAIFAFQLFIPLETAMALTSWVLAAEVFYLGAFGVWHFERSANESIALDQSRPPEVIPGAETERLLQHMKEAAPYRKPGLTLSDLSASSGLAEETVTAAIKHAGYKHFFDFVNAHRCESVKAKLQDDKETAILTLALEAGFNSKSAFNRVFKERYGLTPSQYRAKDTK